MSIGDRIEERRLAYRPDLSQAELARKVGMSQSTMNGLVQGRSRSSTFLPKIARELGTTIEYLEGVTNDPSTGALPAPSAALVAEQLNSVLVPLYAAPHAMGGGSFFDDQAYSEMVPLTKAWLAPRMAGSFADLMLIPGRGDSMEPTIRDGDVLLVDRAQTRVVDPDLIWAFGYGDTGMVKRLRRQPKGGWLVMSDNKVVPAFKASDAEIHMTGRVVAVMNWK